jgi:hypothetical protein
MSQYTPADFRPLPFDLGLPSGDKIWNADADSASPKRPPSGNPQIPGASAAITAPKPQQG